MKKTPSLLKRFEISAGVLGHLLLVAFGVMVLIVMCYQYWYGEFGHRALAQLNNELAEQQRINTKQQEANNLLRADIHDLKTTLVAVEGHARTDLGFVKSDEIFVQLSTSPVVYGAADTAVSADDVIEPTQSLDRAENTP